MKNALTFSLVLALLIAPAGSLSGQTVLGKVLDAVTQDGVGEAEVTLRVSGGEVVGRGVSEASGRFVIHLSDPGIFVLSISRLGYATGDSALVQVSGDETRYLEVELQPEALGIPGFTVVGDPQVPYLELSGFYHRRDMGYGRFLGPEEVDHRTVTQTSEYLRRVPFIRLEYRGLSKEPVVSRGPVSLIRSSGPCYPDVVLDGIKVREGGNARFVNFDDLVAPQEVEAMEVYAGAASVPRKWLSDTGCGLIIIWTRR